MAVVGPAGHAAAAKCSGVSVSPGANVQRVIDAHDSGTTFCFRPGKYPLRAFIRPKSNDRLISVTPRRAIFTGGRKYTGGIASGGSSTGVVLQGFVITGFVHGSSFPRSAIAAGQGWQILNNEVSYDSRTGVDVNSGVVMRGNYIHHNSRYGFVGGPLKKLLVENNVIAWNNTGHHDPNDDAGGSKIIKSADLVFRGNNVHDNYGNGLWCDTDNFHVTFERNVLTHNGGPGIFYEASTNAVIRNNTFKNNATLVAGRSLWWGADLYLNDSKNTSIYGNIVVAGHNGIGMVDIDRGSNAFGRMEIRNVQVHDNSVRLPVGGSNGIVGNRSTAFTSANNRFAHNTYFVTRVTAVSWQWNGSRTWSAWRALGQDTTGIVHQTAAD